MAKLLFNKGMPETKVAETLKKSLEKLSKSLSNQKKLEQAGNGPSWRHI